MDSAKPLINIIQAGAYGWVWGRLTSALKRHLDANVLVSIGEILEADKIITLCPEYKKFIRRESAKKTTCIVHHFEPSYGRTLDNRMQYLAAAQNVVTMNGNVAMLLNGRGIETNIIGYGLDEGRWVANKQPEKRVIGVCGRNYPTGRKNPKGIIEVAKSVAEEAREHVKFVLCGLGWGNVASSINSIDGVSAELFPSDEYDRYQEFYDSISCLLVASSIEGGPYPAIEALDCGRPVVGTPVGFVPELAIECGDFVRTFRHGDYDTAAKLLLSAPRDHEACKASIQHRSWRNECAKWAKLLEVGLK